MTILLMYFLPFCQWRERDLVLVIMENKYFFLSAHCAFLHKRIAALRTIQTCQTPVRINDPSMFPFLLNVFIFNQLCIQYHVETRSDKVSNSEHGATVYTVYCNSVYLYSVQCTVYVNAYIFNQLCIQLSFGRQA